MNKKFSFFKVAPRWWFYVLIPVIVILDQWTKGLVLQQGWFPGQGVEVIPGFLSWTFVRNDGIAFGMFQGNNLLLGCIVISILFMFIWYARNFRWDLRETNLVCAAILGGAVGNLIDRVRLGWVVDFVDVNLGFYRWPAFNIADACITVTVVWLIIRLLFTKADIFESAQVIETKEQMQKKDE